MPANAYKETSATIIELPDLHENAKYIIDDMSLALHLGYRNKTLWWVLSDVLKHYERIEIPKKKGGTRVIHAPSEIMQALSRRMLDKVLMPLHAELGEHVTAYRANKSVRDAVATIIPKCPVCDDYPKGRPPKRHDCPKNGTFIHMDLKNFFPSTTAAYIRGYLKTLGYSHDVASMMAGLMTVRDFPSRRKGALPGEKYAGVPQGAPTSGAICNLVADQRIDQPVMAYLEKLNKDMGLDGEYSWRYSRYSDDLSLVCGKTLEPEFIEKVIEDVTELVKDGGYRINKKKTRVSSARARKRLLGMTINVKPNYNKHAYLKYRGIVFKCLTHGFEEASKGGNYRDVDDFKAKLRGTIGWIRLIHEEKGDKLKTVFDKAVAKEAEQCVENSSQ
jgi:RNA-directed DNA polymerase